MSVVAATHTVVKTIPATHRFGQGILTSRPFAGRMPFTSQDLADAAQMFADDSEPDWDAMAFEPECQDRYERLASTIFGHCLNCGQPYDDLTEQGLCDHCNVDAGETSTPNRYR